MKDIRRVVIAVIVGIVVGGAIIGGLYAGMRLIPKKPTISEMGFRVRDLEGDLGYISNLPNLQKGSGVIVSGDISYDNAGVYTRVYREWVKFRIILYSGNEVLASEDFMINLTSLWRPGDRTLYRFVVPIDAARHQITSYTIYFIEGL